MLPLIGNKFQNFIFKKEEHLFYCLLFFESFPLVTNKMHSMGHTQTVSGDPEQPKLTVL